ncbi:hypothetical protein EBA21_11495 [Xanthomonas oryzae pv. oryzae]|nr:hypothetical protein EBA21_11495 [Xanthomonas oryzae pv. oryzae]
MTWATPFGSEVAQVRSPGSLHNRWCCDPELKPPLDSLKAGLQAAAAKEGEEVLAKATMKRIGIGVLRLGGWQVTVALVVMDVLIYALEPDALEKWCESNWFGKVSEGWILGFGASRPHYKNLKEQDEAFKKAIGEVTARPN